MESENSDGERLDESLFGPSIQISIDSSLVDGLIDEEGEVVWRSLRRTLGPAQPINNNKNALRIVDEEWLNSIL